MTHGLPSLPTHTDERDGMRPRRSRWPWVLGLVLVIAGVSAAVALLGPPSSSPSAPSGGAPSGGTTVSTVAALDDSSAHAPAGTRIIVRVVNASGVSGLARRATLTLRDFGYDVVDYTSERAGARKETEIVVHTGHDAWAARLQRALGTGRITSRPDSLRYLDLTVILGRDWQAPTEPLRP
jgi:hypothetical protein